MPTLYDNARHEPLTTTQWNEGVARTAIARIAEDALRVYTPGSLWPMHPLDDPAPGDTVQHGLYFGAGGVMWALQHLRWVGAIDRAFDFAATIATLVERNRAAIATWDDPHGSFLFGDAGLLWLQWQATPDVTTGSDGSERGRRSGSSGSRSSPAPTGTGSK